MSRKNEYLERLLRPPKDHPYDGRITEVYDRYVHVRLAGGGSRRIIKNVLIADHLLERKENIRRGVFCKISNQYQREQSGRWILTDIFPHIIVGDYGGVGTGIPGRPILSVSADCDEESWSISWSAVNFASSYELYWATDDSGSGATLITEQLTRTYDLAFDTETPPKKYFAVRAISGLFEGALSPWTSDPAYLLGGELAIFGDDDNHGTVTPAGIWWRVQDGVVERSADEGENWADVTPDAPDDDFSQSPAPGNTDISYTQVLSDSDGNIYVVGIYCH